MKKGGTAVRSKSSKRAKDQRGFKYFLWILPFFWYFYFRIFHCMDGFTHFLITNRQEAWQTVIL